MNQPTSTINKLPVEPASVNAITLDHPWEWIAAGWKDFRRAPVVSLLYGAVFVVISYGLTFAAMSGDLFFLVPPLGAGFFLVAPLLAIGLYDVARRLDNNEEPSLARALGAWQRNPFNLLAFGLVLMMALVIWMMVANLVFVLFFSGLTPTFENFIPELFLSGNSPAFVVAAIVSGSIIAFLVFSISAISVPMMIDRDVDMLCAVMTSVNAVKKNLREMLLWASIIVMFVGLGLITFYIGLMVFMPLIGYASWHAYSDLVLNQTDR